MLSRTTIQCRWQIYSDRRSRLLGENTEKLLFLAYNIRLFDFKYWSLHAELMLRNDWRSEWNSRLKCELLIMGLSRKIFFSCICYFMLLPVSANHNCNHNQICIASWTEIYRGAECIRPIPESGTIATFYFFYFSFSAENEIAFLVLFIFRPKRTILLRSTSRNQPTLNTCEQDTAHALFNPCLS